MYMFWALIYRVLKPPKYALVSVDLHLDHGVTDSPEIDFVC